MKFRTVAPVLLAVVLLSLLAACGGGGGSSANTATATPNAITATLDSAGLVTLTGENLINVAGMEVTLTYDSQSLTNPQVTAGSLISGGLMSANTSGAGVVRMAAITTQSFSGTGTIATIAFTPVGTSSGRILSLTTTLVDNTTNILTTQTAIINP